MDAELAEVEIVDGEIVAPVPPRERTPVWAAPPVQTAVAAAAAFAAGAATVALLRRHSHPAALPAPEPERPRLNRAANVYVITIRPLS